MSKKTIAIDIDDVLAANAAGFVAFSNERWGTNLTPNDYSEHWAVVWDVDNAETERRATEFHASGVMKSYRHFEAARPVLKKLSKDYRLVVATSRRKQMLHDTLEWIDTYFEGVFSEVRFAGMWDKIDNNSIHATKAGLCKQLNASFLIDDQIKHCIAASEAGIQSLLFGSYSWNRLDSLPRNVTRVADWQAVAEYFYATG